jgi:glycosyltransferase involved in cell wall biosynthesis
MKICIIGVFSGDLDEGYKNIAFNLSQRLSRKHDVLDIDTNGIFSFDSWKQIKEFKPDILHYLTAPTLSSFVILRIAKVWCGTDVKLVVSSLRPYCLKLLKNPVLKGIISLLKPDVILTQCDEVKEILGGMGCNTTFLPNGVDTERFIPADMERKETLREKYAIGREKFVILHVGHIRETRGIKLFKRIQEEDDTNQVIVVGSSYFKTDEKLYQDLIDSGCLVWKQYFENIEEVYAMADCYVFPTPVGDSIFMPLSVLEAMSCNITVLSTRYEGLIDNFEEGAGLIFIEGEEEFIDALKRIKSTDMEIETRNKVLSYTWDNIAMRLGGVYEELKS